MSDDNQVFMRGGQLARASAAMWAKIHKDEEDKKQGLLTRHVESLATTGRGLVSYLTSEENK